MTTNASLLIPSRFAALTASGITHFQVTLDGPAGELHDQHRRAGSGRGTFDRIMENVRSALSSDIDFSLILRIHVHPDTRDHLDAFRSLFSELDDSRISVLVRGIADLGGPNTGDIGRLEDAELQHYCDEIQMTAATHAPSAALLLNDPNEACYAALPTSWVVRSDGRIGKCTVALDDARNDLGYITPEGRLVIDNDGLQPWLRGLYSGDTQELECPLQNLPQVPAKPVFLRLPEISAPGRR